MTVYCMRLHRNVRMALQYRRETGTLACNSEAETVIAQKSAIVADC